MAINSPNTIQTGGGGAPAKWSDETVDPSASGNTGVLPRFVNNTANDKKWYVDQTGVAKELGSSANTAVVPQLEPVLDFQTASELAALTGQEIGNTYIVTDGAKKADIAKWDGTEWLYFSPTDQDITTVTTGANSGGWQYDSASDSWTQISTGINAVEPNVRPVAGNFAMPLQRNMTGVGAGFPFIVNDRVAAWGGAETIYNVGDNTASENTPRKMSWNWTNGINNAYSAVGGYAPHFVDVASSETVVLALDDRGKVWATGTQIQGTGLTTTPTGSTAITQIPNYGFQPVPFFQSLTSVASRVYTLSFGTPTTTASSAVLMQNGELYVTGAGTNGRHGNGSTAVVPGWFKYPITDIKEVKLFSTGTFVLTVAGDLYFSGNDTGGFTGTVGAKTTPVLVSTNVKQFDSSSNNTNVYIVKNDGTYWNGGVNTNGQLGRGNTTNVLGVTQVTSITNASKVFVAQGTAIYSAVLRTDGTVSFAGQDSHGMFGISATASTNRTSYVSPTGTFQGVISDVHPGQVSCMLVTNAGAVWGAGSPRDRGMGSTNINTNWVDMSRYQQVPLPEPIRGLRQWGEDTWVALMQQHKFVAWGALSAAGWQSAQAYMYGPTEVALFHLDNGIAIKAPAKLIADAVGTLTSATAVSVSEIVDGVAGQTVTFVVDAVGTFGLVNVTGTTVTGSNITSATLLTTSVGMTGTNTQVSLQFLVDAADIAVLVPPNTQPQTWTMSLVANGV